MWFNPSLKLHIKAHMNSLINMVQLAKDIVYNLTSLPAITKLRYWLIMCDGMVNFIYICKSTFNEYESSDFILNYKMKKF